MRKMKIAFVLGQRSIDFSGGFRIIAGYADQLNQRGHSVTIIAPGGAPKRPAHPLQKIRQWMSGHPAPSEGPVRPFLKHNGVKIKIVENKETLSATDLPDTDIIVATWWETAEWVSAATGNHASFHMIQDHEIFPYLPVERAHAAHRLPLRKIVVSKWLKKRLAEHYDINDAILIENAVEFERFETIGRDKPETPTIGFAYSGAGRKNSAQAILVCRELRRRYPDLRVLAFGSMPPKRSDKMPGWIDYSLRPAEEKIVEIYGACTAWLFTSNEEGFGLPILEAMASGTPVVATPAGAAPQIVNLDNGALVARNIDEITDAAERILKLTPEGWGKMSVAAIATARRRSWKQAADELEAAFYGALSE